MTRVLLIRHGESSANKINVFAGHFDADLEPKGLMQAQKTAQYIADNYDIYKIYSSDLKRAFKTGKALSDLTGKEIIPSKALREIYAGKWEGSPYMGLLDIFPEDFNTWLTDIGNATCTGGESVAQLGERVMSFLTAIAKENDGKTIAVTTHATPIRVMQTLVQTGNLSDMKNVPWVSNASVSSFVYDGGKWAIESTSYDEHLGELKNEPPKNV